MKIRLADYVSNFLVDNGIDTAFSVVGGGAMHLNDAFGHKQGLKVYYNHHEQASSIAAEAYARIENKPALVCVTTGPGGINALTGVACAYLDSIPMIVISGQVRYDTTSRYALKWTKKQLRALGDQEYDIVKSVERMTKYAVMLEDPKDIRYVLEKGLYLSTHGRKGPIWIDIPVNFQGTIIDTDELKPYDSNKDKQLKTNNDYVSKTNEKDIDYIIDEIKKSKRAVLYAGNGIRLSNSYKYFRELIEKLNIPIATYFNTIDLIENDHNLYVGRGGNMGDRAGNFAIQNSDLVLALGTRLSIRQVGYDYKTWARAARVIMLDIDEAELNKHTIHIDKKIHADLETFLPLFNQKLDKYFSDHNVDNKKLFTNDEWIKQCNIWKDKYRVVDDKKLDKNLDKVNVYAFFNKLSENLKENSLSVVSNGACCVAGSQSYIIKKGTRFINNSAIASMGYGLPASIGACIGANNKETICLEGDGSIMMNLQELQTIITNNLNIKIFMINNNGYHSIRITQNNIFKEHSKVGIGPESHDLSFPDYKKIAEAFGFKYFSLDKNNDLYDKLPQVLKEEGPFFCEVFTDTIQEWEPKCSGMKKEDGTIYSRPLEDLAPFLSRVELKQNMYIEEI